MSATAQTPRGVLSRTFSPVRVLARRYLPHGRTLPPGEWQRRHNGILLLLWALAVMVPLYGIVRGHAASHDAAGGLGLFTTALLATRLRHRSALSSALASFGLCSACALAVHLANGAIEAHFMFFVMIIVVSLYEDWRPFLIFVAFVVAHHGITGVLEHGSVYDHSGNPWILALIHGGFVLAAGVASVVHWRMNETVRAELERASSRAGESEARFRSAFEDGPVGMALVGATGGERGKLLQVNRTLCERFAFSASELVGTTLSRLMDPVALERVFVYIDALVDGHLVVAHDELTLVHRDGYSFEGRISMSLVGGPDGSPCDVIVQIEDVTERNRLKRELQDLADHDPLTGMLNRRRFNEELSQQIAYGRRYGVGGAVLLLDLDNFKEINDTLGHEAGDAVLVAVAGALTERVRSTDTVARLGGDEFAMLIPEATIEQVTVVARETVERVAARAIAGSGRAARRTTASIGVVVYSSADGVTGDQLINDADLAMYEAKDSGGNRFTVYSADPGTPEAASGNPAWPERIRRALDEERFAMFAQPILDIHAKEITHYELLLRMIGVDGKIIPPLAFLPVAERRGMIRMIDRWVIRHAVSLLADPLTARSRAHLQVNISGRSLSDPDFLRYIRSELEREDADPTRLVFEITETAAIANVEDASAFLRSLSELGCGIALDDFGAGFGSLHYLKNLPIDVLKIDGQFIKNLTTNPDDLVVVQSLVRMARGLRMKTAAEYVEDVSTLQLVRDLGVDYAQGYHIGRPGPARHVIRATQGLVLASDR
jgi:diguanylate cyclase (GGDEF)-like protein/PAS domain S-box-containing protein